MHAAVGSIMVCAGTGVFGFQGRGSLGVHVKKSSNSSLTASCVHAQTGSVQCFVCVQVGVCLLVLGGRWTSEGLAVCCCAPRFNI